MSPFEQRALAGIISHGIPNTLWRIKCSVMYVLPRKYSCKTNIRMKDILILPRMYFTVKIQSIFDTFIF